MHPRPLAAPRRCGTSDDRGTDHHGGGRCSGDVTVFAAASLTAAFTEIGEAFMTEHPDATVTFNFASSSDLVTQINEGAPADVFASADEANMTKLTDAGGNAGEPAGVRDQLAADHRRARATPRASPAWPIWPTPTSST